MSEAVEQTQEIIQTSLNQRHQGFEINQAVEKIVQEDKKVFVSKIPRLSHSISRAGQKGEQVERENRLTINRASSSPLTQKIQVEKVRKMSDGRALSSSP